MAEGAGEHQVTVHHVRVEAGEEIGDGQHPGGVHEKAAHEAVMHRLGGGNGAEGGLVTAQYLTGHGPEVRVGHGIHQRKHLLPGGLPVDGGGGHQVAQVVVIGALRQAEPVRHQLQRTLIVLNAAPYLHHGTAVPLTDGPGIVPRLQGDDGGGVTEIGAQKGLAGVGGLEGRVGQQVEALHLVALLPGGNGGIADHSRSSR